MVYLFIQHEVRNYSTWKQLFDSFLGLRRASGEKSCQIFHPDDDPNNLLLLCEWDSLANARKFMANPAMKEAMSEVLLDAPRVYFLEQYHQDRLDS
jgi:heme-degrading monooxygenase HmoA